MLLIILFKHNKSYIFQSMHQANYQTHKNAKKSNKRLKRAYHKITVQQKELLIQEVFVYGNSIRQAAQKIGIKNSTAKLNVRKYKQKKTSKSHRLRQPRSPTEEVPIAEPIRSTETQIYQMPLWPVLQLVYLPFTQSYAYVFKLNSL